MKPTNKHVILQYLPLNVDNSRNDDRDYRQSSRSFSSLRLECDKDTEDLPLRRSTEYLNWKTTLILERVEVIMELTDSDRAMSLMTCGQGNRPMTPSSTGKRHRFRSKFQSTKTEAVRRLKTEAEAVLDQPTIDFQGDEKLCLQELTDDIMEEENKK
ncbi:hypothetical protein LXL04_003946 [Taraxacum kok-saghyz]